jgi:hypothetical protein
MYIYIYILGQPLETLGEGAASGAVGQTTWEADLTAKGSGVGKP